MSFASGRRLYETLASMQNSTLIIFIGRNRDADGLEDVKLSDLTIITTLGVGGFGRVELVRT